MSHVGSIAHVVIGLALFGSGNAATPADAASFVMVTGHVMTTTAQTTIACDVTVAKPSSLTAWVRTGAALEKTGKITGRVRTP